MFAQRGNSNSGHSNSEIFLFPLSRHVLPTYIIMPFGLNRRLEKTGTNLFKSEGILQAALIGYTITSHLNGNFT